MYVILTTTEFDINTLAKMGSLEADTTVLNLVISPKAEGDQIHLNVVTVL